MRPSITAAESTDLISSSYGVVPVEYGLTAGFGLLGLAAFWVSGRLGPLLSRRISGTGGLASYQPRTPSGPRLPTRKLGCRRRRGPHHHSGSSHQRLERGWSSPGGVLAGALTGAAILAWRVRPDADGASARPQRPAQRPARQQGRGASGSGACFGGTRRRCSGRLNRTSRSPCFRLDCRGARHAKQALQRPHDIAAQGGVREGTCPGCADADGHGSLVPRFPAAADGAGWSFRARPAPQRAQLFHCGEATVPARQPAAVALGPGSRGRSLDRTGPDVRFTASSCSRCWRARR